MKTNREFELKLCKVCNQMTNHGCLKCSDKQHEAEIKQIFDDIETYRMDLVAFNLEFFGFKTMETGKNKMLLKKND